MRKKAQAKAKKQSKSIRREVGFMQHIREYKIGLTTQMVCTQEKKIVEKDFYTKLLK